VSALLQPPETRSDVEFFGRMARGRAFPLHISINAIRHAPGEPLTIVGTLTFVRDRRVTGLQRVEVRLYPQLRTGDLSYR
jgi:hypothetical protein